MAKPKIFTLIDEKLEKTHNTSEIAHEYIQNAVATAQTKADSAYTTATSALPKSGGTGTDCIFTNTTINGLKFVVDSDGKLSIEC